MAEIPQAAIDAAKEALIDRYDVPNEQLDEAWLTRDAQVALSAAAPHLAAAERERIERGLKVIAERYRNAGVFARAVLSDVRDLLREADDA